MKENKLFNVVAVLLAKLKQKIRQNNIKFAYRHRQEYANNFNNFSQQEGGEWRHFRDGRESFRKYLKRSVHIFRDYFIPYEDNGHRPKILRLKSLSFIAVILIILKFSVFSYIFLIYTQDAKMSTETINRLLALTNEDRAANNLRPLILNSALSRAAQAKAEDMVVNNYFSHYSPSGAKPWDWISRDDYPYLLVGENLAMNFSSVDSAQAALMASPTHKQNILNSRYEDVGLALISGQINNQEGLILVELFAVKKAVVPTPAVLEKTIIAPVNPMVTVSKTIVSDQAIKAPAKTNSRSEASVTVVVPEIKPAREEVLVSGITTGTVAILESPPVAAADSIVGLPLMATDSLNQQVSFIQPEPLQRSGIAASLIKTSKLVYILALAVLIISLLLNIFIRIRIQHKAVIMQTSVLIVMIIGLMMLDFDFLNELIPIVKKVIVV